MAEVVKCLLRKPEDLNFDPQGLIKKTGMVVHISDPSVGETEKKGCLELIDQKI